MTPDDMTQEEKPLHRTALTPKEISLPVGVSRRGQMTTYCPWSGKKDCGCTAFPSTWEGLMPKKCESHLSLASAEVHVQAKRVSPELTTEVKRWVAAGRPRLDRWVGEDDGEVEA